MSPTVFLSLRSESTEKSATEHDSDQFQCEVLVLNGGQYAVVPCCQAVCFIMQWNIQMLV